MCVGGIKHEMLHGTSGSAEIEFIAPKSSLLKAVRREIFDDLLIGNFMKTKIKKGRSLYDPDFTLRVAKYSDNGRVKNLDDLKSYYDYYNHNRLKADSLAMDFQFFRRKLFGLLNDDLRAKIKYLIRR